jgi:hypothetical protein
MSYQFRQLMMCMTGDKALLASLGLALKTLLCHNGFTINQCMSYLMVGNNPLDFPTRQKECVVIILLVAECHCI